MYVHTFRHKYGHKWGRKPTLSRCSHARFVSIFGFLLLEPQMNARFMEQKMTHRSAVSTTTTIATIALTHQHVSLPRESNPLEQYEITMKAHSADFGLERQRCLLHSVKHCMRPNLSHCTRDDKFLDLFLYFGCLGEIQWNELGAQEKRSWLRRK